MNNFYKGKKVFVTGHTGFKGSWMCQILKRMGAEVTGYSLAPNTTPALFDIAQVEDGMNSHIADIRDGKKLTEAMQKAEPEIVFHLAAQPIVRDSYKDPVYTYETNVMGTVNILEAVRMCQSVRSMVNVTTDKVYVNREWVWGYRENEELNGYDPYSNSKSCSELVTSSYKKSFFSNRDIAVSTVRAGNVIGGGDFANDRIIPDCVRAVMNNEQIVVRNPLSIRPYQHVLEPVMAYLHIAQAQYMNLNLAGEYNIGPDEKDCITTGELVQLFCDCWQNAKWTVRSPEDAVHEANFLKLDCSKAKNVFGWKPSWSVADAVAYTVLWVKDYIEKGTVNDIMAKQIETYSIALKKNMRPV